MRYLTGIQIATTDTTGGAPISGQLDWGTPETFDSLAYRVEWDGDKRFGLGPYVQQKTPFDWIAKARGGKSLKKDNLEELMKEMWQT